MKSLHSAVDYQSTEWLLHVNIDTIDAQSDLCFHVTVNKARQAKKSKQSGSEKCRRPIAERTQGPHLLSGQYGLPHIPHLLGVFNIYD